MNQMKTIDIQLTNNFALSEFCTTSQNFDVFKLPLRYFHNIHHLANLLQRLRNYMKKPVRISSGYRPETLNTMVDGVKNSFHLVGAAADIYFENHEDFVKAWQFFEKIFDNYYFNNTYGIAELLGCPKNNWFHISVNCNERPYKHLIIKNYYKS